MTVAVPELLHTDRLLLRPYRVDDAERLRPILVANVDHLQDWLPRHVWEPVDLPELRKRLTGYATAFAENTEWRYAVLTLDGTEIVGSAGLFPRDPTARVAFAKADRVETGYWIRQDRCGLGYATEVTRAMIELARSLPGVGMIEIRCNAVNAASVAVPRRLGFRLATSGRDDAGALQVWTLGLVSSC